MNEKVNAPAKKRMKVTSEKDNDLIEERPRCVMDFPYVGLINLLSVSHIGLVSSTRSNYKAIISGVEVDLNNDLLKRDYLAELVKEIHA